MNSNELDKTIKVAHGQLQRAASRAGTPTAQHNLRPKTKPVLYRDVQPGDVIMESTAHPVVVLRCSGRAIVKLLVRYVWQSDAEAAWPLGSFPGDTFAAKAVTRRGAR